MQIVVEMDDADFDQLASEGLRWRGNDWEAQADRFEPHGKPYTDNPSWDWKAAYWVGPEWSNVILARSFLKASGESCEIVFDTAEHPNGQLIGYVVLTNYETANLKKQEGEA